VLVVSILTCSPFCISACSNSILFYFIELTMLLSASFTCLDACCCHGLRLPVFNKETTYLLTWNGVSKSNSFRDMRSKHTGVTSLTFSRSRDASRGKNGTNMFIKQQRVTQYNYNVTNDRHRHPDRRTQHCSISATVSRPIRSAKTRTAYSDCKHSAYFRHHSPLIRCRHGVIGVI